MQEVFSSTKIKYGSKKKIKILFNQLYAYAMKNDIISKDYSKYIDIGKNTEENTRKPFTNKEIERLWDLLDENDWIDTILILIYTGFRIGELLEIKNSDIDLKIESLKVD
ncbi:site-specific recombinase, phage integrase family (plasmid) [Leptotrichia wadei]|uniref:Site-specific recombinase, phage integrase family n=2 Tax=Leptotrichia wadei TaxID=157687 RepID=A0A510L0R0_9FUSO|nr:site-specific recombinase, phage integrase family [Leptotrichia wadei]